MAYEFTRNLRDALKAGSVSIPAANATVTGAIIDLEMPNGGRLEDIQFEIVVPQLANQADAKALAIEVVDSADGAAFASLDPVQQTTVTGAGGVGSPAKRTRFRLPPQARRYVALKLTQPTVSGDSTALKVALNALF